jgi:hypothetical protein
MTIVYFLVSSNIISNAFNFQHLDVLYCLIKENFHVQFNTLSSSNMPILHPYYCLLAFLFFFLTFIFCHIYWCSCVFLLLEKLRSFSNQNIALIWSCLDLEMFVKLTSNLLGIWPCNKQNGFKSQFFLEWQVVSSLILKEIKVERANIFNWCEKRK